MKRTVVVRPASNYMYVTVIKGSEIEDSIVIPVACDSGICDENMRLIRDELRKHGIRNCSAGTVIPDRQCMIATVESEYDSEDCIKEALFSSLNLTGDEDYVFDYRLTEAGEKTSKYFCVVTDRSLVTDYKALFIRYGLRLDYLIPESVAIGNIIRNAGLDDNDNIFMDYGDNRIVIRAYKGIECVAEHEIDTNEADASDSIGNIKLTLDYYDENAITSSNNTGIYVYGEGANDKNILCDLRSELDCGIYPVKNLFHSRISNKEASLIFPAMGSICQEGHRI